ncbi:MAG: prolipoprotein diacylglyceryl transferase, partial [Phycisphaerales bacterium]
QWNSLFAILNSPFLMHPTLFTLPGGIPITTYGFCMMVGFLLAVWLAMKRGMRVKADPDVVLNLGFFCLVGGVIGARLFYVAHYWRAQFADRGNPWLAVLNFREGGMEFLGGFIGAAVIIVAYLVSTKRSLRLYLDILAPSVALGLAFGRIGCFFNGCCFGGVCLAENAPEPAPRYVWAVEFPYDSAAQRRQWEERRVTVPAELLFTAKDVVQPMPVPRDAIIMSPERREGPARNLRKAQEALRKAKARNADQEEVKPLERRVAVAKKGLEDQVKNSSLVTLYRAQQYPSRVVPSRKTSVSELEDLAAQAHSLPVHPTQLYSSMNGFLMYGVLVALFYVRKRHGVVMAAFFVLYPVARFLLEGIRTDNPHDAAGLTASQFISVVLFTIGVVSLIVLYKFMPERSRYAVAWVPPKDEKSE